MGKSKYLNGDYGGGYDVFHGGGYEGGYGRYVYTPEPARPLTPHVAATKVERLGGSDVPTILVSVEAYRDMNYIMEESGTQEISWLGTIKETEHGAYLIEKVFLFKQTVSYGHTEIDQGNLAQFYADMLKASPDNKDLLNSILFWGHVHPGSWVGPSGQDESQMDLFAHNKYFIRGIFSRQGHCEFTFFDYERKLKIIDCPWQIHMQIDVDEARKQQIAKEIKKKVSSDTGGYGSWSKGKGKDWWKDKSPIFGDS